MLLIKRVTYETIEISPAKTLTLTAAAKILQMSKTGVISAIDRGRLTEIIDDQAKGNNYGRRLLLKSEVEALSVTRQKNE